MWLKNEGECVTLNEWLIVEIAALGVIFGIVCLCLKLYEARRDTKFWRHHWDVFSKRWEDNYCAIVKQSNQNIADLMVARKEIEANKEERVRLNITIEKRTHLGEAVLRSYLRQRRHIVSLTDELDDARQMLVAGPVLQPKPPFPRANKFARAAKG